MSDINTIPPQPRPQAQLSSTPKRTKKTVPTTPLPANGRGAGGAGDFPRYTEPTMIRRDFLKRLAQTLGLAVLPLKAAALPGKRHLIQQCHLAGFQYHEGEALWHYLTIGDRLELRREPDNRHDKNAIRVDWNGRKLGYLPRTQNQTTALMLDNDVNLEARIGGLATHPNPWRRVAVEVWMVG